jgi:outer membrane autotransporter protein
MNCQARSEDRASDIRRRLILGTAFATSALLGSYCGYVPRAYADCSLTGESYTCSGTVTTTQTLTGASVAVTADPNFNITTTAGNAFTITSTGLIAMLMDKASAITGAANGIEATASSGSEGIVIDASGTGKGTAGSGISVVNSGSGGVLISSIGENESTGKIIGATTGISVNNHGTDLVIAASDVSGGTDGISAVQDGSGALTIRSFGSVAGELKGRVVGATGVGISAEVHTGGDLSILSKDVSGGTDGISAVLGIDGTGAVSIIASGGVSGGSGVGIHARNDSALPSSTTSIAVGTGATVSGATAGIALESASDRAATVINAGAISGGTGILAAGGPTTISNTGDISAGTGPAIDLTSTTGPNIINQQGGTIAGEIALSDSDDQVHVTGGRIEGDIVGKGAGGVTFHMGPGSFSSPHAISGVDEIAVSSGRVRLDGTIDSNKLAVRGGSLVLNGDANVSEDATVSAGTLVVGDETHAEARLATNVTVNDGGMLGGIGTIGGLNVGSGGVVAPGTGTAIGRLTVTGPVTFNAGSTFQVRANAAGQSDQITATGAATLSGGTVAVIAQGTGFLPQTTYTILQASGVTGTFAGVNSNLAFLTPTLSYDAEEVHLTLALTTTGGGGSGGRPIAFSSVALNANQRHVADAVQGLGLGHTVYKAVVGQTVEGARQAFAALSGVAHASIKGVMLGGGGYVQDVIGDRLRQGFAPRAGSSAALDGARPALAYAPRSAAREVAVTGPLARVKEPVATPPLYTLWGEGFGGWGRHGGNSEAAGFDTSAGGFALGADAPLGDALRVGVAGGYSRTSLDGQVSSGTLDSYYAALYGGGQWGALGLRLGAAYGWQDLDTTRSVVFPGFAETLTSSRDAHTVQAFGELGYRMDWGSVALEPFGGLAYVNLETDPFTEQGGVAGLSGFGGSDSVTFTTLGLRAAQRWMLSEEMALTLRGTVGWQHAFGDTDPTSAFIFAGGSQPFTVAGTPIDKDALILKAGAEFDVGVDVSFGVSYSAQLAKNAQDQQVKGILSVRF